MSKKTAMLLTPTLAEVELAAAKIGLPEIEAHKFWNYYESNGWRVGRVKMVSFLNALAGWKLRWIERQPNGQQVSQRSFRNNSPPVPVKDWRDRILDNVAKELEGD